MRLFRHFTELPPEARGGVVALGNFDGVHRGHQRVIGRAGAIARELGVPAGVTTFEPHPRSVFKPDQPPFRLTPLRIKARHIEALGVDYLYMQHFDLDFARLTAEAFVEQVLVAGLGVRHVVVGYDYVFGRGRGGDVARLGELAAAHGFAVTAVDAVRAEDGGICSSTRIREFLRQGKPAQAARLLGYCWEIEGRVEAGARRGRQIGFPTVNLTLGEYLRPAAGVYAVRAGADRGGATLWRDGVANIGHRPTFGGGDMVLEAHLFDVDEDLYGQHMRVALVEHLRAEKKFDSLEALKRQIVQDGAMARRVLDQRHLSGPAGGAVVPPGLDESESER